MLQDVSGDFYKLAKIARHNSIVLYKFKNGYIANESESNIGRWQYFKYVLGSRGHLEAEISPSPKLTRLLSPRKYLEEIFVENIYALPVSLSRKLM